MRGVFGEQRRRHGDAVLHGARGFRSDQGLATQHAVLVGKRETNQFELVLLDRLDSLARGFGLLVGPKTMTLDKTLREGLAWRHQRPCDHAAVLRRLASVRCQ